MKESQTKHILAKALKKLLGHSLLKNITVTDVVSEAYVSRQTFYYHFSDIYELLEWAVYHELKDKLNDISEGKNLKDSFCGILFYALENRKVIEHVYLSIGREVLQQYLHPIVGQWLLTWNLAHSEYDDNAAFTARFLKYSFVGIFLDWVRDDMKEKPHDIVEHISKIVPL